MRPLYPDEYLAIDIEWSRPSSYERVRARGHELDRVAQLYLITAKASFSRAKSLYVGKTYRQTVSTRLAQQDHQARYAAFKKHYPRHRFLISLGVVTLLEGRLTAGRLGELEKILIYANDPEHAFNVQNFYEHGVKGSYEVVNHGHRAGLPKAIMLGVFAE